MVDGEEAILLRPQSLKGLCPLAALLGQVAGADTLGGKDHSLSAGEEGEKEEAYSKDDEVDGEDSAPQGQRFLLREVEGRPERAAYVHC
jgi:hypothetical protein